MTTYIIRRLLLVPVLLIGVTVLIFGMMQMLSPVERTALYLKDFPKNDKAIEGLIKRYGFDQPETKPPNPFFGDGLQHAGPSRWSWINHRAR